MQLPLQATLFSKFKVEKWGHKEKETKEQYLQ